MLSLILLSALAGPQLAQSFPGRPRYEFLSMNGAADADVPVAQAWALDGSVLLVAHEVSGEVTVIGSDRRTVRIAVGGGPSDLEICPVSGRALVPQSLTNSLAVIDVGTTQVIATIPLSGRLPYQVEIASHGAFAIVACADSDSVSVVDLGTLTEVASFNILEQTSLTHPAIQRARYRKMDLGPDDRTLAVPGANSVALYDVTTGLELAQTPAHLPVAVGLGPSSRYVAILGTDILGYSFPQVFDTATGTLREYETCDPYYYSCLYTYGLVSTESMVVSPTEEVALFAGVSQLLFLDLETGLPVATVPCAGPALSLSRDGRYAFTNGNIIGYGGGVVDTGLNVIDTFTKECLATLEIPFWADQLAVHPWGARVSSLRGNNQNLIDWFDWTGPTLEHVLSISTASLPEGDSPMRVASDASGRRIVTTNQWSQNVTVLDRETGERSIVQTDGHHTLVTVDDAGTVAVVSNETGDPLTVIDLVNPSIVAHLDCGQSAGFEISADGKRLYAMDVEASAMELIRLAGPDSYKFATIPAPDFRSWFAADCTVRSCDDVLAITVNTPQHDNTLILIDGKSATVLAEVPIPGNAYAFAPDGQSVFVIGNGSTAGAVLRIRVDGEDAGDVQGAVEGVSPSVIQVSPDGRYLLALRIQHAFNTLYVLDIASMTVVSQVALSDFGRPIEMELVKRNVFVRFVAEKDILRVHVDDHGLASIVEWLPVSSQSRDIYAGPNQVLYSVSRHIDGLDTFDFLGGRIPAQQDTDGAQTILLEHDAPTHYR